MLIMSLPAPGSVRILSKRLSRLAPALPVILLAGLPALIPAPALAQAGEPGATRVMSDPATTRPQAQGAQGAQGAEKIAADQPEGLGMSQIVRGRDFLAIGFGVALSPTYAGSNDYVPFAIPVALGSFRGMRINPRGAGLALDLVRDPADKIGLDAGLVGRLRVDRVGRIGDEVVARLDGLDMAIEIGPTVGVRIPQLLNPYDNLAVNFDVLRDINGAHEGVVLSPNFNYTTPLGVGVLANLTGSAEFSNGVFQNYYFRITAEDSLRSGLPAFEPSGAGFTRIGASLLLAFDLDGDLRNGGWSLVTITGYSRVLGDAANNPMTRVRGNPNQLLGAFGIGYLF